MREHNKEGIRRRGRSSSVIFSKSRERLKDRNNPIKGRRDLYNISPPSQRRRLGSVEEPLQRAYIMKLEKLD